MGRPNPCGISRSTVWSDSPSESRQRFLERMLRTAWPSGLITQIAASGELVDAPDDRRLSILGNVPEEIGFRFKLDDPSFSVGQGTGNSRLGDRLSGRSEPRRKVSDLTAGTFRRIVAESMPLPTLVNRARGTEVTVATQMTGYRNAGPFSCLALKETALQNVRNKARQGQKKAKVGRFRSEDLRFRHFEPITTRKSEATFIGLLDRKEGTTVTQLQWGRAIVTWVIETLCANYDIVDYRFIVHGESLRLVDTMTFFSTEEIRSGYLCLGYDFLADEVVPATMEDADCYLIHISDGWGNEGDCEAAYRVMSERLAHRCVAIGYGQVPTEQIDTFDRSLGKTMSRWFTPSHLSYSLLDSDEAVRQFLKSFFRNSR